MQCVLGCFQVQEKLQLNLQELPAGEERDQVAAAVAALDEMALSDAASKLAVTEEAA